MLPSGSFAIEHDEALYVNWTLGDGSQLHLVANFGATRPHRMQQSPGDVIYATDPEHQGAGERLLLPYSIVCVLAKNS
jgi:hypothetical protein